mmetsp:Transcript_1003/g.1634  ORF Transcript_1003/g.1634 Transcript_1003/m.1634 type:complete len:219 (+) Transcript_1003:962-1618(+)
MWKPSLKSSVRSPVNKLFTPPSAPSSIKSGFVITGIMRFVVGSTPLAFAMISVLWKSTLAGMTAKMMQRSFCKKSCNSKSISAPSASLSPFPLNRTIPGRSTTARLTESMSLTLISTTSLVTSFPDLEMMNCCAFAIAAVTALGSSSSSIGKSMSGYAEVACHLMETVALKDAALEASRQSLVGQRVVNFSAEGNSNFLQMADSKEDFPLLVSPITAI